MRPSIHPLTLPAAALALALGAASARALEPADIAVVFNSKSPSSLQIARYYLNARKIPPTQLIPIICDPAENITENLYRTSVVPQLLKTLGERKLLPDPKTGVAGIKCLVTTYDVPLRILAHEPTALEKAEVADDQKQLEDIAADLQIQIARYDNLAKAAAPASATSPATGTSAPRLAASAPSLAASAPATATAPKPTWQQILAKVQTSAQAAARRIEKLPEPDRSQLLELFIMLQDHVGGTAAVLRSLSVPADAANGDAARRHLSDLDAELRDLQQQYQALLKQRDSARIRKEIIALRLRAEGLAGQAAALDDMILFLRPDQTAACFDNELTLLLADQGYPRGNWLSNPKSLDNFQAYQRVAPASIPPSLLVCRLDGATPAKAQELIDTALKVEAKGLDGKLYLDARGLRGTDAYAIYDSDIRRAADWMKLHSTLETVIDDTPEFFQAKNCPDAALYCGWYSLHNYLDSCQWVPGAVGFHVASFEMTSLHTPKETGWVVNLLNRGFAGTLGPTDEPYLHSFPKPSQFFPLLACGEFTQGEVWQVTCPLLSWRQGFVGDPLYNPFKAKPRVKIEDLLGDAVLRNAFTILGHDVPKPPSP